MWGSVRCGVQALNSRHPFFIRVGRACFDCLRVCRWHRLVAGTGPHQGKRKKGMTGTSKEAGWVMRCSRVFCGGRDVSGDTLQPRFDEARQLVHGLTDEPVPLVCGLARRQDEYSGLLMRCADRHDAALWCDIAVAFMQRD